MEKQKNPTRIPRENLHDHDQDERLTNKHIQTLGFLQEIVNENKGLKIRIAELEVSVSIPKYVIGPILDDKLKEKILKVSSVFTFRVCLCVCPRRATKHIF